MSPPEEPRFTFRQWCEAFTAVGKDLDRVLSVPQWAKLASLSERTAREVIERGDGPKVVQLSPNRIGVRLCDHREWLAARTKSAPTRIDGGNERGNPQ
jgi:predicted DNA-binding transcriptional regulator AlpA